MKYSTVIDIGSSKVMCMIASPNPDGAIAVEGLGMCEYRGYRFGNLPSPGVLSAALESAVKQAQTESGIKVHSACIGVPVPFTNIFINSLEIAINSKDSVITGSDINYLLDCAVDFVPPEGYKLMHSTPFGYKSDGIPLSDSPVGKRAGRLSAKFSHSLVRSDFKTLVTKSLKSHGIKAGPFVSTAMASALFMIPYRYRSSGAILIDCGGSHCDVLSFLDDALITTESIGMGGLHIASDLSLGLRIPFSAAEQLKRNYKFNYDYGDSVEHIQIPGEGIVSIENSLIKMITEARTEELGEMLSDAIYRIELNPEKKLPVYMIGSGIALMDGGVEYLSALIGRPIRCDVSDSEHQNLLRLIPALGLAQFMLFGDGAGLPAGKNIFQNIKEFFIS